MLKKWLAVLALLLASVSSFAAVDVNTARTAELTTVKGIGPDTAREIMKERRRGKFKDWNDFISRVKGVGAKRAAQLSAEGLTLNGAGFSAPTEPAAPAAKP